MPWSLHELEEKLKNTISHLAKKKRTQLVIRVNTLLSLTAIHIEVYVPTTELTIRMT